MGQDGLQRVKIDQGGPDVSKKQKSQPAAGQAHVYNKLYVSTFV